MGEGSSEPLAKRKGRKRPGGGPGQTGSAQAQSSDGIAAWDQRSSVPHPWRPPLIRGALIHPPPGPMPAWQWQEVGAWWPGTPGTQFWLGSVLGDLTSFSYTNQLVLSGPAFYLNAELCPLSVPGGSSWLGPGAPVPHTAPSWRLLEGALGAPPCTPQAPPCSPGTRGSAQQLLFCQLPSCS